MSIQIEEVKVPDEPGPEEETPKEDPQVAAVLKQLSDLEVIFTKANTEHMAAENAKKLKRDEYYKKRDEYYESQDVAHTKQTALLQAQNTLLTTRMSLVSQSNAVLQQRNTELTDQLKK